MIRKKSYLSLSEFTIIRFMRLVCFRGASELEEEVASTAEIQTESADSPKLVWSWDSFAKLLSSSAATVSSDLSCEWLLKNVYKKYWLKTHRTKISKIIKPQAEKYVSWGGRKDRREEKKCFGNSWVVHKLKWYKFTVLTV